MKKNLLSIAVAFVFAITQLQAQSIAEGIKNISYIKLKSAKETLQKIYNSNTKDAPSIYWYGQALIANKDFAGAKAVYQKALQDGVNEPLIWIGTGHVELREGGDLNAAKQKFEQAVTATIATKGKNKGKADPTILNAIGRANADGASNQGDANYGIEKLKQAAELDLTNAEIFVNMGKCYQKLGGDMGGEAVKAYTEAITRDPKNAEANWRIGLIYASQNNKEQYEQYYNAAIAADVTFPPVYLSYYRAYETKNVNVAKDYLDKFMQYADKDCGTDYFYADYLFRAGKYQESLEKAKVMEGGECKTFERLPMLFAYNYDRLGDSLNAKANIEKYFAANTADKIEANDYELAVKVFSKFPGLENTTVGYLQKAIDNTTDKEAKLGYMKMAADMFAKAKMYKEQVQWLQKLNDLKGTMGEFDYYQLTNASYLSKDYVGTMAIAQKYIAAFPDKPQGYSFNVRSAKALDTTSNPGIAEPALLQQNEFLAKDAEKNKNTIVGNLYYIMVYYVDKAKDYAKGLEYCDKILAIIPGDQEMLTIRKTLETRVNKAQQQGAKPATPAKSGTPK